MGAGFFRTGHLLGLESEVSDLALGSYSFASVGSFHGPVGKGSVGWCSFEDHEDIFPEDNLQEA